MLVAVSSTSSSVQPNMRSAAGFHMRITLSRSRATIAIGAAWITARSRSLLSRVSASSCLRWVMSTITPDQARDRARRHRRTSPC